MNRLLNLAPKPVLISAAVLVFAALMFAILVPVLGGARDDAVALGQKLASDISGARTKVATLIADQQYVAEHLEEYEALLASDKLVPHTRRAAVVALTQAATAHGVTGLNYSFVAADALSRAAVASQSSSGGYTVAVETIDLKIDAPLDGPVYRFLADIMETFPGFLTVNSLTLARAPEISGAALAAVSAGAPSELVTGEISLSWRTAQADKSSGAEKAK
jgi:hypothetical protein